MKSQPNYLPNPRRKAFGKVLDVFIIIAELFAIGIFIWVFLGSSTYLFRIIDSTIRYNTASDSAPVIFVVGLFTAIAHATISFATYAVNGLLKTIKRMRE